MLDQTQWVIESPKSEMLLRHYSEGLTLNCDECEDHFLTPGDHENLDYDPFYSTAYCESSFHVSDQLAGNRYIVHEVYENNTYRHLTVCTDCYEYLFI